MGDAPDPNGYTTKEYLVLMEKRADERHDALLRRLDLVGREVDTLDGRVGKLERSGARAEGGTSERTKIMALAFSVLMLIVNIPAAVFYMTGGRG